MRADGWPAFRERRLAVLARHSWPADQEVKWHHILRGRIPPAMADDLIATDEDTYHQGLMYLTERFHRFLGRQNDHGAVVVENRMAEVDFRLRRFFDDLLAEGTPYMKLDRLVDTVLLGPSHHSIGLQAADLVVGATMAGKRRLGDASRWHRQLLPRFARHPDTLAVEGAGLVEFPRPPHASDRSEGKLLET